MKKKNKNILKKQKDNKKTRYIGCYIDEDLYNAINLVSYTMHNNNRSKYIESILEKDVDSNFDAALEIYNQGK